MHALPWFALPSHTPVHGDAGVPAHAAPPTETAQIGHGWVEFAVRMVCEFSLKSSVAPPVAVSSVPDGPVHVPVPAPVQHGNGLPEPTHCELG